MTCGAPWGRLGHSGQHHTGLLTAGPLPNTVTAALMITDPKIPTMGD